MNCSVLSSPPACGFDGANQVEILFVATYAVATLTGLSFSARGWRKCNREAAVLCADVALRIDSNSAEQTPSCSRRGPRSCVTASSTATAAHRV